MNIFDFDSPFMNFLTKAVEYMLVCILCLIFSIPVFTIGAATTASYYVGMKLIRGEDNGFFKSFIKGFKENFKQSTIIWLVELLVGCFIAYDWFLIYKNGVENYNRVFIILLAVISLYLAMTFLAIFALIARFEMSIKEAFKGALAYTYVNVPRMFFVLVLTAFPTVASIKYFNWLMAIWPIGSAACLYIISFNYSKSFKKLELRVQGFDENGERIEDDVDENAMNVVDDESEIDSVSIDSNENTEK